MPRRVLVLTFIALFSLGLLSIRPAFSETPKAAPPTVSEELSALSTEVGKLRKELAEDRMARKEFALEMRLLEKDMEGWHTSTKTISELMRPTGDWIRGYFNLIMGIVAVLVTVFVGIIGGLFRREVKKVKEVDKEAKELRDRTEGYMKEASQVIAEMESRKEAMDEAFAKQDEVIANHVEQAVKKIDEEKERAARFGQFFAEGLRESAQGHFEAALKAYEKSIELSPDYAPAWVNKAHVLVKLDRPGEALSACEEAIKLDPEKDLAWYNKACAHSQLEEKTEMLDALKRAVEFDPEYKEKAEIDPDFEPYRDDPDFQELIGEEPPPSTG